jgi:uncharacterized membrane protein
MMPAFVVLSAWVLFGGTHLVLGSPPVRDALTRRLGEPAFIRVYTLIAAVSLLLLGAVVARFGGDGAPGLYLASLAPTRWILAVVSLLGTALAIAGLVNYARSPMAFLARAARKLARAPDGPASKSHTLRAPAPVERITRHPFFVGLALLMGAHALMASTLSGAVFFAGFAVLAIAGIRLQDAKLLARHGETYSAYLAATSALPFAASFRPTADTPERIWPQLLAAAIGAALVAALHPLWSLGHGAPFAVLTVVGGVYAVAIQFRKARSASAAHRSPADVSRN